MSRRRRDYDEEEMQDKIAASRAIKMKVRRAPARSKDLGKSMSARGRPKSRSEKSSESDEEEMLPKHREERRADKMRSVSRTVKRTQVSPMVRAKSYHDSSNEF